jgi:uncharacterized protein YecT (DUF1311 family)
MRFFTILTSFGFIVLFSSPVLAQGHGQYCAQADSTAAIQNCIKNHLDSAQKRLNKVYKGLEDGLEVEQKEELKALQQSWLQYRDAECMWEAGRTETASLKRINELSCMARVTEDRADILTVASEADEKNQMVREYGSFPRWMNVVAKDNPDVFWDYGTRTDHDLNCDDENEHIMRGVRTSLQTGTTDKKTYTKEFLVAITGSPAIGRPVAKVFKFNMGNKEQQDVLCDDSVVLKYHADGSKTEPEAQKSCSSKLEIQTKGCSSKFIVWTGKDFTLESPETKTNEEDTKEKQE